MKIVKKYMIAGYDEFEVEAGEYRELNGEEYYDHNPTGQDVKDFIEKYKCKYISIPRYWKVE